TSRYGMNLTGIQRIVRNLHFLLLQEEKEIAVPADEEQTSCISTMVISMVWNGHSWDLLIFILFLC
ncbi:hypothetical protein ACJX0J_039773, partial [Zea mays]